MTFGEASNGPFDLTPKAQWQEKSMTTTGKKKLESWKVRDGQSFAT